MCSSARAGVAAARQSNSRLKSVMRMAADDDSLQEWDRPRRTPKGPATGVLSNSLWSYLCGEFVKHPEKAKNGQDPAALPAILSHPSGNLRDWARFPPTGRVSWRPEMAITGRPIRAGSGESR